MKYSGLMSVYRKESPKLFNQALSSILKQDKLPDEFVLVKDGPLTEKLENVIDVYASKFAEKGISFNVLRNDQNLGLGLSLRKGVETCSYDWIARFDSDDINDKFRMKNTLDYIAKNPDVVVVGGYISEFVENTEKIESVRKVPLNDLEIKKYIKKRNPFNHMSVTLNKRAVVLVGNYQDVPFFEDYDLWNRIVKSGYKVGNIPNNLVFAHIDKNFYVKRGGLQYFQKEISFQRRLLKNKNITLKTFIANVMTRGVLRLLPKRTLKVVYDLIRKA